ncbi:hypothetical protein AVEN_32805-1, partial [Araneus ventricosus]
YQSKWFWRPANLRYRSRNLTIRPPLPYQESGRFGVLLYPGLVGVVGLHVNNGTPNRANRPLHNWTATTALT